MAAWTWPGRGQAGGWRQVSWHAGGRRGSVPRSKVPALHCPLLPQRVLCHASLQGETGAKMLKAIHAQEGKKAAREKANAVVEELRSMKLKEAAKKVEDSIEETLTYCDFPSEHWTRIRTNNVIERLNREIRRRTRVVGSFPDGNSALMLVCARLRHVAGTQWGNKKYMNMKHLEAAVEDTSIAG